MSMRNRISWPLATLLFLVAMPVWAANHTVAVGGAFGFSFSPATLTINVGDTVTFTNGGGFHNVVSDRGTFRCAAGCDGDGAGGNGNISSSLWSATVTFSEAGSFGYFCEIHGGPGQGMFGTINVQGGTTPPPPLGPGYTGAWFDPAQSGHGFFVEVLRGDLFLAYWFTFTPDGEPVWFGGVGPIVGNTAVVDPSLVTGGRFIPNFDPSRIVVTPWGRMTFTFTDCNTGRVDFASTAGYGTNSMPLKRLTLPAGLECNVPAEPNADAKRADGK